MSDNISNLPWIEGRGNPQVYYDRWGLKCCTPEAFAIWFKRAEASDSACRQLDHFCNDCILAYRTEHTEQGTCVAVEKTQ